jgi:hypothetical protein
MLDIILNEKKIVDEALKNKVIDENPIKTLRVLIKHYYLQGMTDKNILKEQLLYFMSENYYGYKRSKWEKSVENIVSKFLSSIRKYGIQVELTNIESVKITKAELERIKEISNLEAFEELDSLTKKNLEKICFIMLIYAKLSNIQLRSKESWISKSCSSILKEAKVNLKGDEKKRIFYYLYSQKYISQSNSTEKTSMKINYIDVDEESEVVINIDNFENVIYYYMNYRGESWKRCEGVIEGKKCIKWVKVTNNKVKYCSSCAKSIKNEQDKIADKKYREKQKNEKIEKAL